MRFVLAGLIAVAITTPTAAQEIFSEYTDLNHDSHCTVVSGGDSDGDWANLICQGWRGYPVLIYYADGRESLFYGFPPSGDLAPAWESFVRFNHAGPKVEWRVERDGARTKAFATIHRWFVTPESEGKPVEVLVVQKVSQLIDRESYVVATGNPNANETARRIADDNARNFRCGDRPTIDAGSVPVPTFSRVQN